STLALDLNALQDSDPQWRERFSLILSNFGALNCVQDLRALVQQLSAWIRPDGVVALTFMGRFCAWESAYFLSRGDRAGLRRWRGRTQARVAGRHIDVRYWSV